jgi:hypothetical protein
MKRHPQIKTHHLLPLKTALILVIIFLIAAVAASGFKASNNLSINTAIENINKDSIESVNAFAAVYNVLMSPRCMNCHPSGDVPLQGDDSHLHTMLPTRGKDGKGVYAMKCTNCHQPENTAGEHAPPGNPNWHLPPAGMKMVFQGRTPDQLAKQLVNPKLNGNKTKQQLIEHADDGLVVSCWNPGDGRTLPPISHQQFKKEWVTWLEKGAYTPKAK